LPSKLIREEKWQHQEKEGYFWSVETARTE